MTMNLINNDYLKMEEKMENKGVPCQSCVYEAFDVYDLELSIVAQVSVLDDAMGLFSELPSLDSGLVKIDYTKVKNFELLLNDLRNFCANLFPHSTFAESFAKKGIFFTLFKKVKRQHVKFNDGKLSIKMDENFDAGELLGIPLNSIQQVEIFLPENYDETMRKKTFYLVSLFLSVDDCKLVEIQDVKVFCRKKEFVQDRVLGDELPTLCLVAEAIFGENKEFIGGKFYYLPENFVGPTSDVFSKEN